MSDAAHVATPGGSRRLEMKYLLAVALAAAVLGCAGVPDGGKAGYPSRDYFWRK